MSCSAVLEEGPVAFCPACGSPQSAASLTLPPPAPDPLPTPSALTPPTSGLTPPTSGLMPPTSGLTPPTSGLTPPPAPTPASPASPATGALAATGQPPSWQPDPFARYTYRYWNGRKWTNQVSNGGDTITDPLGAKGTPLPSPNGNDLTDAGWYPDPAGRHQHRYWKGRRWTDQVADNGVVTSDPPNVEGIEV